MIHLKLLPDNKRPKIFRGIETIVERWRAALLGTSAMVPPRYGKSDLIRGSVIELRALNSPPCVVLAPWVNLADQIKEKGKVEAMLQRFGVASGLHFSAHRCLRLKTDQWWKLHVEQPDMITMTMQVAHINRQQFLDGIEDMASQFGSRVPLFIDECHLTKKVKEWGILALAGQERGAYLVPVTGTIVPGIPQFDEEYGAWRDVVRKICRHRIVDGEKKYFQETYEGQARTVSEITAEILIPWREAWAEGALARANKLEIDCEVVDQETNEIVGQLSVLTKEELSGSQLREVIEGRDWTAKAAEVGVQRILARRIASPGTQMLIVTGFDLGNGSGYNRHAELFKESIEQVLANIGHPRNYLRIEIATGVDAEGNPDAAALGKIKHFAAGKIDILIVKMMGIVGSDVPSCKIEIYASPMRNGPMAYQALSRPLTIWDKDNRPADLIVPADQGMRELYKSMIEDQGGSATESNLELVDEEEIEPPEPRSSVDGQDSRITSYSDETGTFIEGDFEETLLIIKAKYHVGSLTDTEIIENYRRGAYPVSTDDQNGYRASQRKAEESGFTDLDDGLDNLEGKFGEKRDELVNKWMRKRGWSYGTHRELWIQKTRHLASAAKRHVGISGKVNDIDDAELLRRLIAALYIVAPTELPDA